MDDCFAGDGCALVTEERKRENISQWLKEGFTLGISSFFLFSFQSPLWSLKHQFCLLFSNRLVYSGKLRVGPACYPELIRREKSKQQLGWRRSKADLLSSPNLSNDTISWAIHGTNKVMPTSLPFRKQTQKSQGDAKETKKSLSFEMWGETV